MYIMALQIWLPLNGNLNNQGLAGSVTVTNHGATVNSSGKIGSCYSFITSQYMELNNVQFSSLNAASVCFWVKIAAGDGDWLPFTGQSTSYYILATSGGTGNFYHQNSGSGTIYCDGVLRSSPINDGKWHHYCITNVNLSTWTKFYINCYGSTGAGWNFNGQMNDIRIYDHCLSPKEVHNISKALVLHYSLDDSLISSTVFDESGYQNDGVITGSLQISEGSGRYLRSSKFSSYTNYITSSVPKITSCTISWLFKPDSISNNLIATGQDGSHYVAAMNGSSFYNNNVGVSSNLYIDGEKKNVSSTSGNVIYFSAKLLEGWHHYCLTNIDISTWTTFKIGNYGSSWPINGLLSDFRIYATALSEQDVKDLYNVMASIDSSANMYTYEYYETNTNKPRVRRTGVTDSSTLIEPDTITNASFSNTGTIKSRQFYEV